MNQKTADLWAALQSRNLDKIAEILRQTTDEIKRDNNRYEAGVMAVAEFCHATNDDCTWEQMETVRLKAESEYAEESRLDDAERARACNVERP